MKREEKRKNRRNMMKRARLKTHNTKASLKPIPSEAPESLARFPKGGHIREGLTLRDSRLPQLKSRAKFSHRGIEVGVIVTAGVQ